MCVTLHYISCVRVPGTYKNFFNETTKDARSGHCSIQDT